MRHNHITKFRGGFETGCNRILSLEDTVQNVGMEFSIVRVKSKSVFFAESPRDTEVQIIVLDGRGDIILTSVDPSGLSKAYAVSRKNLFSEQPWAFDLPHNVGFRIETNSYLEVAIIKAKNTKTFEPVVLRPEDVPCEQRGEGLADGTMHRVVRAIFGDPMAIERARPKESNLVVGEVVNLPGKWSSFPPHYHPHNEIYYYRFDKPEGFGASFTEGDETALVVKSHDVVKIMNCTGHAQVSAPGYAMWYLWFIRQIDGNRYEGNPPFTFFPEDKWVLDPDAKIFTPTT